MYQTGKGRDLLEQLEAEIKFEKGNIELRVGGDQLVEVLSLALINTPIDAGIPEEIQNQVNPGVWASEIPGKAKNAPPIMIKLRPGARPVRIKQYPLRLEDREGIRPVIDRFIKYGLLKECESEYNTPILPVKKPDGNYRIVQDLRTINKIVEDLYPVVANPYTLLTKLKAQVAQQQVTYLRYEITAGQRTLGTARKEAICQTPQPQTVKELRTFLGMTGWCHLRIDNYGLMSLIPCFTPAGSLHTLVLTPPPRLYLPRNFSYSACLYGSLVEQHREACSPDGDTAPPPVGREAASEKPLPPRGRETSLPTVPRSPTQRRRAKSLPTPSDRSLHPTLPQSSSRCKTVQFADSLGLELTSVRQFCEADLPPQPCTADLFKTRKPPALGDLEPVLFGPPPLLEPLFPPQPGASPGFMEWVQQHRVRLEWVRAEPAGLHGAVRVLNLAYEKAVSVRYTLNSWASCAEVPAVYQAPDPTDGIKESNFTDSFTFLLPLGALAFLISLELAIRYCIAGAEYWDNNEGKNYRLRGRQHGLPATGLLQDPDSSAWIHFI
ncbi:LOW QUALITY PROTEIN: uncharacterized protein AAGF69_015585 [Amazona ochrocephala]